MLHWCRAEASHVAQPVLSSTVQFYRVLKHSNYTATHDARTMRIAGMRRMFRKVFVVVGFFGLQGWVEFVWHCARFKLWHRAEKHKRVLASFLNFQQVSEPRYGTEA